MNTCVLIVGAGPVGLTLACELTRYRVPVRIIDKAAQRTDKSKAIVIWSRTLELLDRGDRGSAPFVEVGFKVNGVNIVTADGHVMGHVRMDSVASPYAYAMMLPQSDTERLLEERLQRLGVSVERSMGPRRSQLGATAWRRRFAARMAAKRNPCGLARRMRRRTQHCAPHARSSLLGGDNEQRPDSRGRPYAGISVRRYRGRSLLGARRRASESFRSRRGDIASSPTLPPTEGTILAIRRLKKFRPSSSGAGRGARACSIPSGCPASGQFFHA